jgi:hypothetical protein
MKNKYKILYIFLGITLLFTACTPKEYELGALMDKSALEFTITPSGANPNDIVLESLTPNVTPSWVTPYGQSLRVKDTINVPFPGTYKFVYGVESAGGFVQADTAIVIISTLDQNAVSTPMWVNLAGGYGHSKTWVLDIDASGVSKYFYGPVYYAGPNYSWEWDAGWASWIMPAADYGSMTFDLIGDAHFSSNNKTLPAGLATGKFMLYPGTSELATFNAQLLHDAGNQGPRVDNWYAKALIKSLTANTMQIVEVADGRTLWLIYNYISLDYYNSH